jgi:hypothetical protein
MPRRPAGDIVGRALVVLLVWLVPTAAWAGGREGGEDAGRLPAFPLDALVAGMEGYALTAVPGGIERFPITVLALQHGLGPHLPLVLVEAGGPMIEAAGGVAAGMSGSPVYLTHDGRESLLGALAYVFPQSDARLALVMPIEAMRAQAAPGATAATAPRPERLAAIGAAPAAAPVLIGGLGPRALSLLERTVLVLAPHALQGVQAGGGSAVEADDAPSVGPGDSVALQLIRGDVTVAVIGTVTEVWGGDLLAFGHPFLGVGPTAWPLSAAPVTAIVSSRLVPFKLANVGSSLLGSVVEDRPAGIGARLAQAPEVIPVTLSVTTATARSTLRFDVAADERLWPLLMAVATLEALDRAWQRTGPGTADVAWLIDLPGGAPLRLTEQVSHAADVSLAAARLAGAPLALLAGNHFEPARPEAVELAITIDERRRDAEVVEVLVDGAPPAAGGPLALLLRLQPWRRASEVKTFSALLPPGLEGTVEVQVRGGGEPRDEEDDPFSDVLLSYGELLIALRERPQGADLVVEGRVAEGRWQELGRLSLPYVVQGVRTLSIDVPGPADDEGASETTGDDP